MFLMNEAENYSEKINKNFRFLFRHAIRLRWDTEENNKVRAENYKINAKTTSITIPEVSVRYIDKRGDICGYLADSISVSLLHNDQLCDGIDQLLDPKEEFALLLSAMHQEEEYVHVFKLINFNYQGNPFNRRLAYMMDDANKTDSTELSFVNEEACQYLNVFIYILLVNNIFIDKPVSSKTNNMSFSFGNLVQDHFDIMSIKFPNGMTLKQFEEYEKLAFQNLKDHHSGRIDVGEYGERLTEEELVLAGFVGYNGKIVKNLYVPKDDGDTTEIDVLYICRKGIVVIESKNYSGWIFGRERDQFWTATLRNGEKNRFYNPVMQNWSHIRWLRKFLEAEGKEIPMFSVIAFSERCALKKIDVYSSNVYVINRNEMEKVLKMIWKKDDFFSEEDIKRMYNKLNALSNVDERIKQTHIDTVKKHYSKKNDQDEDVDLAMVNTILETMRMDYREIKLGIMTCPECGARMILKPINQGTNEEYRVYGCSRYPDCEYVEIIE